MPKGIYQHKPNSKETNKKISAYQKLHSYSHWTGKKMSIEHRKKISNSMKGKIPKNIKLFLDKAHTANKGSKRSIETRIKQSVASKKIVLEGRHNFWKGGISKINRSERMNLMHTLEYKLWREAVFKRDNFTCVWCGQRGKKLNADHIQVWKDYPNLRFAIDNGRTLCVICHRLRHTKIYKLTNKK